MKTTHEEHLPSATRLSIFIVGVAAFYLIVDAYATADSTVCFPAEEFPDGYQVANPLVLTAPRAGDVIVRWRNECFVFGQDLAGNQALMVKTPSGQWLDMHGPLSIGCPEPMVCDVTMTMVDGCCAVPRSIR